MIFYISSKSDFEQIVNNEDVVVIDMSSPTCQFCNQLFPFFAELSEKYKPFKFIKLSPELKEESLRSYCSSFYVYKNGKLADHLIAIPNEHDLEEMIASFK